MANTETEDHLNFYKFWIVYFPASGIGTSGLPGSGLGVGSLGVGGLPGSGLGVGGLGAGGVPSSGLGVGGLGTGFGGLGGPLGSGLGAGGLPGSGVGPEGILKIIILVENDFDWCLKYILSLTAQQCLLFCHVLGYAAAKARKYGMTLYILHFAM